MPRRLTPAKVTLAYAAIGAAWIVASGIVLQELPLDPALQVSLEIAKGLGFILVTSGLLYALLRMWQPAPVPAEASLAAKEVLGARRQDLLMLAALALAVPAIGTAVYVQEAREEAADTLSNLRVIAEFKAHDIENWLAERRGDAVTLARSAAFAAQVRAALEDQDAEAGAQALDRLASMRDIFAYDAISLLDESGRVVISSGEGEHGHVEAGKPAAEAVPGRARVSQLHRDAAGRIHLHVTVRVPGTRGSVRFDIDPDRTLFPLVKTWPTASPSGEALLARRDGDSVLYLSRLRHRDDAAMTVRLPKDRPDLPAAVALRGRDAGTTAGMDYRGVDVLAAWHPVTGTDWMLLAKQDRREALASARASALWISAIALAAVVVVFLILVRLQREQRLAHALALRVQADQSLRRFYDLPFIGIVATEPVTNAWLQFNDKLCAMSGYSREELLSRKWTDILDPEDVAGIDVEVERMTRGQSEGYIRNARFRHKDGSVRIANLDVKCVRRPDGTVDHFLAAIEDITERVAAEARIRNLSRLYLTLSRCNVAMVRSRSEQEMFDAVCRAAVEAGSMAFVWVGEADPATGLVRPVASYGGHEDYLAGIRITTDAADDHGRGPTGTAIREGVPFWCQDFQVDPRTAPWRKHGARHGWRASAALPLRRGGRVVGALTIYMTETNAFDDETRGLLEEIASDIGFGLDNFDREAARRAANAQLAASEERHRLLFENSMDGILLTVPDGRILAANPTACQIFRATEAEIVAGGRNALVDLADPRLRAALEERERTGSFRGEITMVRRDGERFPANVSTTVFRDHSGEARSSMIIRDVSEEKRNVERLAHLAQHDALTDLPNRLLLTDRLNMALARARRSGKPLALLFLDLDRFKNVNDSLGHEHGDHLLVEASARLRACVRASDTVSRQGGDEFLILLSDIDSDQDAARVAQKLIDAVSKPFQLGAAEFVLTASIGIACHPDNGTDAETLMRNADAAMYAAKQGGRNRYQFYSAEMNARTHDRLRLETDLRHAIARGELFLVYQPQMDLGTGEVVGAEALVRWQHPRLGLVPPGDFIGIAEDSGQIVAIGAWVLETACRQQAAWVAEGLAAGVIAVNVSAHQFRQAGYAESVAAILASSGLRAEHLELEVTESAVMQGVEDTLRKLNLLDQLGVKLSIDDFGTGYSSLSYLKQFPLYRLKIDQSFTRGLPGDAESSAIVQAVISMGHSLGLNVLAEGVETSAQEERLREMWCDAAQGYLYSRPVPAAEYAAYLRARATTPGA